MFGDRIRCPGCDRHVKPSDVSLLRETTPNATSRDVFGIGLLFPWRSWVSTGLLEDRVSTTLGGAHVEPHGCHHLLLHHPPGHHLKLASPSDCPLEKLGEDEDRERP